MCRNASETIEHFLLQCPRFHSHRVVLHTQLLALNVATCDLPTLLAAAGVHPSRQHTVIHLTCAFLRKTGVSAPSFLQCYKLTQSAFNIEIATPEAAPPVFIDKDDQSSRWLNDISAKNLLEPRSLSEIQEPVCAIGLGVCALLSAVKGDPQQWAFRDIALTGSSLAEVTTASYFSSLPLIPGDAILDRAGIFSTGAPSSIHIVVNAGVVTGQNPQSTLSAVQNMILLANQR
ncbi:Glutamine amidotransferase-like class 1 domain-containing protein 1 [Chionoecetes opilio]|uniref:Glutamine amidotransferase-like class 1 domain-containing protein 1 n=1 Tax=Chionoecetes opilio TaxID=41210 RepID=A0A8J5CP23_CHIOP|nr:Glutamine amidotransferase-like class 1 domain-containing protein 1 [Chionoecetes opilio]